jgi:hypothetical protein
MTAATITTPNTRLRLTTRGRRVLAAVVAIPLAAVLSFGVISGGSALASRHAGAGETAFTAVTVLPGDSLWSLAQRVAPGADPRDVVDAISRLNALDTSTLRAGQVLSLPAEYAS